MERKYCLKLEGRFAGRYEILKESEVAWLHSWLSHLKRYALTDDIEVTIDKLIKVFEVRSIDE